MTLLIALYGALTGTVALMWDYAKWLLSETRLSVRVQTDMQMAEGDRFRPGYCILIVVQNRGGKPTTVTLIGAEVYQSIFRQLTRKPMTRYVIPRPETTAQPIPFVLEVGREWSGWVAQTPEMEANSKRRLYLLVYASTLSKPVKIRVKRKAAS
jgi:hypothetical protein